MKNYARIELITSAMQKLTPYVRYYFEKQMDLKQCLRPFCLQIRFLAKKVTYW